ncbi:MAG: hypothetical protein A2487_04260 [Candidatus Raymondbacteria bacterium RifOxyC12_full_50_8]|uniref:Secretion system C-terminal sorting domain-containing protein n=1 Tax=Candidatus Raymondbacteria bacterium RIFOXYD12_FULL_49_13 TaxID=1817890 RepID=A0A1F7F708_UNCRA|nr:MAG: hypothetical protein A2248_00205 [Candidatus Raymondbacteria bacterium RIFOXYA2_FULL_49_16]OGJ96166.1 MAG: hypothetical protein A2453_05555 [Candidatus Raymondbacteria bacterium RIFOXYC2_FULL_50_21]OGK02421.1 MAG: hypothetical protein A2519_14480 [Candidatus Raymondbacteria bacterium RIFOXYD12_FULL_49_13]OGK07572.1 MAG: hypothetical protein A2487_04260 [Candidatus Raymondbacteria bacterium RifOxyC12_full_50_8]OGP41281.1 MAG: hypothetical protein A2324_16805 [Candidatus Raymondbacteria b
MVRLLFVTGICAWISLAAAQEVHVFWYKAGPANNNYLLTESSPGPGIPAGAMIHESMMASATVASGLSYADPGIVLGSATGDDQGWCSGVWSLDLNADGMTGIVDSAFLRFELNDGWMGDGFCNAGPINLRVGVIDASMGITMWGGPDQIAADAVWGDLDPINALNYTMSNIISGTQTNVTVTGLSGRTGPTQPSVLDGQFARIDITTQVDYILATSGQFAIVLLAPVGQGSTGKMGGYATELCDYVLESTGSSISGSDDPWTTDGNTVHLLVYGDLTDVKAEDNNASQGDESALRLTNTPNPFNPATAIYFETGRENTGTLTIYDAHGSMVHRQSVHGNGSVAWGAMSTGLYICALQCGKTTVTRKLICVK